MRKLMIGLAEISMVSPMMYSIPSQGREKEF